MKYLGKSSVSSLLIKLLNFIWYMMIAGSVIFGIVLIVGTVLQLTGTTDINQMLSGSGTTFKIQANSLEVVIDNANTSMDLWSFTSMIGIAVVLIPVGFGILYQLRKIVSSFVDNNPFTPDNAVRIRYLGYLIIGSVVLEAIINVAMAVYVMISVKVPGVDFNVNPELNFSTLIAGVIILILAEIFRIGAELKEDQDLTI